MTTTYDELAARLDELMGRVQVLECDNSTLQAASSEEEEEEEEATVEGVDGTDGAVEAAAASRRLDRRSLLRLGGAATAFGAGAIVMRPSAAGATTANMQYGVDNNAGTDTTGLTSSNATDTLHVTNSSTGHSTSGRAIDAHITDPASEAAAIVATQDGTSHAIVGTITSTNGGAGVVGIGVDGGGVVGVTQGVAPAVAGITAGNAGPAVLAWGYNAATIGDACEAVNMGTGHAIYAHIENAANGRSTIYGTTNGTNSAVNAAILNARSKASTITASTTGLGAAIDGASTNGQGGRFRGKTAQIQLVPSTATTHPASGAAGQLFVDRSARLWFCRGGTSWKQLA